MDKYATFFPILALLIAATLLGSVMILISVALGKRTKSAVKSSPYECGVDPVGDTRDPVPVKFYMVAILFIIFDIEVVFLYPWAVIFDELGMFGFFEMLVFVVILLTGYFYVLGKGALKWD
ncbi:MAG: NADH-quinone oxidoreductase subunit A [candidate division Zixibacteria bacterium]|nr:NADH-quinone oxidoreductase subunit A [candidate division Zixibacteria bacterium]